MTAFKQPLQPEQLYHVRDKTPSGVAPRINTSGRTRKVIARLPKVKVMSGEQIKNLRNRIGVSQTFLAQLLGMSVESVSKWERNEITPSNPALRILNTLESKGIEAFIE